MFDKAEAVLRSGSALEVYVFLDECNTCASMGLICEAIVHRSLNGRRISDQVSHPTLPCTHTLLRSRSSPQPTHIAPDPLKKPLLG